MESSHICKGSEAIKKIISDREEKIKKSFIDILTPYTKFIEQAKTDLCCVNLNVTVKVKKLFQFLRKKEYKVEKRNVFIEIIQNKENDFSSINLYIKYLGYNGEFEIIRHFRINRPSNSENTLKSFLYDYNKGEKVFSPDEYDKFFDYVTNAIVDHVNRNKGSIAFV